MYDCLYPRGWRFAQVVLRTRTENTSFRVVEGHGQQRLLEELSTVGEAGKGVSLAEKSRSRESCSQVTLLLKWVGMGSEIL